WADGVHADDLATCLDTYTRAFDQREPFRMEYRLRRHDGEYRWVLDCGVPRFDPDGSFSGYIGSAVDVTDRKQAELAPRESHTALQERTVELERRTRQLSQMASDLTLAEQRERAALARTLHDGLQQLLVVAAINVTSYIAREGRRGHPAGELAQAQATLDEA